MCPLSLSFYMFRHIQPFFHKKTFSPFKVYWQSLYGDYYKLAAFYCQVPKS